MDFNTLIAQLEAGDTEKALETAKALKPAYDQTVTELKDYDEKLKDAISSRDKAKDSLKEVAKNLGLEIDELSKDKIKELINGGKIDDASKAEIENLQKLLEQKETEHKEALEKKDQLFSDKLIEIEIAKLGLNSDVVNDKALGDVMRHLKEGATVEDGVVVYKDGDVTARNGAGRPIGVAERMEAFKADESNSYLFKPTNDGGGGAKNNGGATGGKKWADMTSGEKVELRRTNPAEYDRMKAEHFNTK